MVLGQQDSGPPVTRQSNFGRTPLVTNSIKVKKLGSLSPKIITTNLANVQMQAALDIGAKQAAD